MGMCKNDLKSGQRLGGQSTPVWAEARVVWEGFLRKGRVELDLR